MSLLLLLNKLRPSMLYSVRGKYDEEIHFYIMDRNGHVGFLF